MNIIIIFLFVMAAAAAKVALYYFQNGIEQFQEYNYSKNRSYHPHEHAIPLAPGMNAEEAEQKMEEAHYMNLEAEYRIAVHMLTLGIFYASASLLSAVAILYLTGIIK